MVSRNLGFGSPLSGTVSGSREKNKRRSSPENARPKAAASRRKLQNSRIHAGQISSFNNASDSNTAAPLWTSRSGRSGPRLAIVRHGLVVRDNAGNFVQFVLRGVLLVQ